MNKSISHVVQPQVVELGNYQFIKCSGPDVIRFLQGQLSCNMDLLSSSRSLRGAICNLKGRVIADVRLVKMNDDCVMQMVAGMADTVLATLSKYAVFSKVKLEIQDSFPAPIGILGTPPESVLQLFDGLPDTADSALGIADASLIRAPGQQPAYELWFYQQPKAKSFSASIAAEAKATLATWHRHEILAGVVHVTSATTEEYTPQLLNYDISGVIDFKKGCYTGQEVVARMFYRGVAKKRLYLASTSNRLSADDSVHQAGDSEGKTTPIIACSNAPTDSDAANFLLTVLSTEAVDSGKAFELATQPGATLDIVPLTYA